MDCSLEASGFRSTLEHAKLLRRTRTPTLFAGARFIISGSTPTSRRNCHCNIGFFKTGSPVDGCNPGSLHGRTRRQRLRLRHDTYCHGHATPGNSDCHSAAHSDTKIHPVAKASSNSSAAPLALLPGCPTEKRGFPKMFFCFYREHVREITT